VSEDSSGRSQKGSGPATPAPPRVRSAPAPVPSSSLHAPELPPTDGLDADAWGAEVRGRRIAEELAPSRWERIQGERAQVAASLERRLSVQRKAAGTPAANTRIPEGGGAPLGGDVRGRMEPRLGADLSGVRVHTGGESAEAATSLGARAFTVGKDVHFGAGEFAPGSKEGDRLLAHELTHVVQGERSGIQRKADEHEGGGAEQGGHEVSHPDEPAEKEADAMADHVAGDLHDGAHDASAHEKAGPARDDHDKHDAKSNDGKSAKSKAGHAKGKSDKAAHAGAGGGGKPHDGGKHAGDANGHEAPASAGGGAPGAQAAAKDSGPGTPASTKVGAANGEQPPIQRKAISSPWVGVGRKIYRLPASSSAAGAGGAGSAAGPAGAAPAAPEVVTERAAFAMSGEGHTLTATYRNGSLDVTMASMPRRVQDAIAAQKVTEQGLIASLSGPAKAEREAALAALNGLESWFNGEEAKIKGVTDPAKRAQIGNDLKALVTTLMQKVVSVGNTYKMKDFVSKSFGIDELLKTLDNQVNKELRKHVGDPGVMGDGHNNTATAAELLGVRTKNGAPVPYLAGGTQHGTRTRTCQAKMQDVIAQLDKIEKDFGVNVSAEPLYKEAKKEIADCTKVLADPAGYLAGKGFKVVSGDFRPL
jgi:hypothetical protein